MGIVRRLAVIFGWIFVAALVVGAFYIMYFIGNLYFQTEKTTISLEVTAKERADSLNNLFSNFTYKAAANPVVIDELIQEGDPSEDAYAEIIFDESGQLNSMFSLFNSHLQAANYQQYKGDLGIYYATIFTDTNQVILSKYTNSSNEVLVVEYQFEPNNLCSNQTACRYLPETAQQNAKPLNELTDINVKSVKVIKADSDSPQANLEST